MVLAHIPLSNRFVHFVHGFHRPLFFVISGYLYCGGGYKYLLKTGKKLLIPYISFSLIGYLLWLFEMKPVSIDETINPLKSVLWVNSDGMPLAGALWFLTAMLFVNIMVFLIEKFLTYNVLKLIVVIIIFILGLIETTVFKFRFPWSFGASCVGLGYFYLGVILNEEWNTKLITKAKQIRFFWYILAIIIISFSIMKNGILNMRTGQYAYIPITVINSVVFIFALRMLIYRVNPRIEKSSDCIIIRELLNVGKYSIIYLCCNELVVNVIRAILRKVDIDNLFILTLLTWVFLKVCEKILTQSPLIFFIGQKPKK